ncbi:MAG: uracil phosphoribosyltransferase [Spirochaetota bacterium]|jgi:uracil phosphoribosyltransferase|nr:uracil phosphoribosyltransferase [Spirochaetota bacterium]
MHYLVQHPLLAHKLGMLRNKNTHYKEFRELASEITMLLTYEAMKDVHTREVQIESPLEPTTAQHVDENIVVVPVLRAGVGMLEAMLSLLPEAKIGFIGIYRDHATSQPVTYFEKLPEPTGHALAVIVDPMLATGGSLIRTAEILKEKGFRRIKIIAIISSPEGLSAVEKSHPDVDIYTGSIDRCLNERNYILPGLGDAGNRLFGTE